MTIPFIDLQAQRRRIEDKINAAVLEVVADGRYIMGPKLAELEADLNAFCGAKASIGCSNGTDALWLALKARNIGRGDAVFVPSFTFVASAEAIVLAGASPVFVDVLPDSFNIDVDDLRLAIEDIVQDGGYRPAAIIAVDLFGQPADYQPIMALAEEYGMTVIADAAQSFGGARDNRKVGSLGHIATTSFFPAKPLGCYGDGGAVFVQNEKDEEVIRSLLFHGMGQERYEHVRIGTNGRLDTLQAAILVEKLKIFEEEIELRQQVAARYSESLKDLVTVPHVDQGVRSAWAQYTIQTTLRDGLADALKAKGIPTAIYYPIPLHLQAPYADYPCSHQGLPVTTQLCQQVLSLPMHPYLEADVQDQIIDAIRDFFA